MARIDSSFPYDSFRFLIRSLRESDTDGTLEGFMGAMQTEFERTHRRIQQLPEVFDIGLVENDLLKYLKWMAGWSDERDLAFVDDLSDPALRKLVKLSVPLWKSKGTRQGLVNAIRVFTGKSAGFRSWFDHRLILDEAGIWFTGIVDDPWIVGGTFSNNDDSLSWLWINRDALDDDAKSLIHSLTTYIGTMGEHYAIVYCAFFDDFLNGTLEQWDLGGDPVSVSTTLRALMPGGTSMTTLASSSELETWGPFQRVEATLYAEDNSATTVFRVKFMHDERTGEHYRLTLSFDGTVQLHKHDGTNYSAAGSALVTLPTGVVGGGEPFLISVTCDPQSAAENRLVASINGLVLLDVVASYSDCYREPGGGVTFENDAGGGNVYIDNVVVTASPTHVQYIGQRSLLSQAGVASPDPGLFPFTSTPAEPSQPATERVVYCTGSDFTAWSVAGFWQVSPFSTLCASQGLWFGRNAVGVFPNQSVDMDYVGAVDASATTPSLDLSSIDPEVYDVKARVWYRPNKSNPSPGSPETVSLQYNIGASDVTIADFDSESLISMVDADVSDSRIADGEWWYEKLFTVPDSALAASTTFGILFSVAASYATTDFGFGVTRFAIEVTRK